MDTWEIVGKYDRVKRTKDREGVIRAGVSGFVDYSSVPLTEEDIYNQWGNNRISIYDIRTALNTLSRNRVIVKINEGYVNWDLYKKSLTENRVLELVKTAVRPAGYSGPLRSASIDDFTDYFNQTTFPLTREQINEALLSLIDKRKVIIYDGGYFPAEVKNLLLNNLKTKLDTMSYAELQSLNL